MTAAPKEPWTDAASGKASDEAVEACIEIISSGFTCRKASVEANGTCMIKMLKVLRTSPPGTHTAGTESPTCERELV